MGRPFIFEQLVGADLRPARTGPPWAKHLLALKRFSIQRRPFRFCCSRNGHLQMLCPTSRITAAVLQLLN
jgi:hypothetical protein